MPAPPMSLSYFSAGTLQGTHAWNHMSFLSLLLFPLLLLRFSPTASDWHHQDISSTVIFLLSTLASYRTTVVAHFATHAPRVLKVAASSLSSVSTHAGRWYVFLSLIMRIFLLACLIKAWIYEISGQPFGRITDSAESKMTMLPALSDSPTERIALLVGASWNFIRARWPSGVPKRSFTLRTPLL